MLRPTTVDHDQQRCTHLAHIEEDTGAPECCDLITFSKQSSAQVLTADAQCAEISDPQGCASAAPSPGGPSYTSQVSTWLDEAACALGFALTRFSAAAERDARQDENARLAAQSRS
ncbi:hypothetical protein OC834_000922 [Tilletia horrida]|nr:hypothetical protein OC834_000922 [Tilletia horrida]